MEETKKKRTSKKKKEEAPSQKVDLLDLQKEADVAKDELAKTFLSLAADVNEKIDSLTSSTLKKVIKRLMLYPVVIDEHIELSKTGREVLDNACKQKDLYIEIGMLIRKEQALMDYIQKIENKKDISNE